MRCALGAVAGVVTGLVLAAPASAQTGTAYGGAALSGGSVTGSSISVVHRPDGRVVARVGLGFSCRRTNFPNVVVRLGGVAQGASFTASGSTRLTDRSRLRIRLTGTFAGDAATGRMRVRPPRRRACRGFSRPFALRTGRPPAAGPARPAGQTRMFGVTGQDAGGIRLPVALHVLRSGRRLVGLWQANMRCGPRAVLTAVNFTPRTRIRPDGTFSRSERYTLRYREGMVERYRVVFRGRFLADGAVGTLRARMRTTKPGRRYYPCDSGVQSWTALP